EGLDEPVRTAARQQIRERGQRRLVLDRAQALYRERARVRVAVARERQKRRQRAFVLEPLQREGERPPAHARLTRAVERGRRELLIRLEAHERKHAEAPCGRRRVPARLVRVGRRLCERTGRRDLTDEFSQRVGGWRVADQAERLGGASVHERRRILQRGHEERNRRTIADQPERERGHLLHFGIGIAERGNQRLYTVAQTPVADRQRRPPANP